MEELLSIKVGLKLSSLSRARIRYGRPRWNEVRTRGSCPDPGSRPRRTRARASRSLKARRRAFPAPSAVSSVASPRRLERRDRVDAAVTQPGDGAGRTAVVE